MILAVTKEELPEINQQLAASFFTECGLPGDFKFDAFLFNWTKIFDIQMGAMWKLVLNGKTVGMMGGILSPDMLDGQLIATEAFWFVAPEARKSTWGFKMLMHFEQWAKEVGAKRIVMAHLLSSFPEALGAYYNRRGYVATEIHYVKQL